MERSWEVGIDVVAPPERAWALAGDPTSVPRWYPQYVRCEVDGDVRRRYSCVTGEHQDPEVDLEQRLSGRQAEALERMKALIEGEA